MTNTSSLREKIEKAIKNNTHCGYYHDESGNCMNDSCRKSGLCSIDCPGSNAVDRILVLFASENKRKWEEIIEYDPKVRRGLPCFKGTRIPVTDFTECLRLGWNINEIAEDIFDIDKKPLNKFLIVLKSILMEGKE
jgi:uncharacterized protein (DUF433 family)